MVTMIVDASPDPYVAHNDERPRCDVLGGQPHRMSECNLFDHSLTPR